MSNSKQRAHRMIEVKWNPVEHEPWGFDEDTASYSLPDLVIVPPTVEECEIDDWLIAKFGFSHNGWNWWSAHVDAMLAHSADPV